MKVDARLRMAVLGTGQALVGAFVLFSTSWAMAANHTVEMKSLNFDPKVTEVKVGDSVEWSNVSYTEHSATFEGASPMDTGLVQPKKMSKKLGFKTVGEFAYHCSVHGKTMSGKVVVRP